MLTDLLNEDSFNEHVLIFQSASLNFQNQTSMDHPYSHRLISFFNKVLRLSLMYVY
jgi:hypothetical protein